MGLIKEDKIGYQLKADEHSRINQLVHDVLRTNPYREKIREIKNTVWMYPGESGKRGADLEYLICVCSTDAG